MMFLKLVWSNMWSKKLSTWLALSLFSLGIGLILLMVQLDRQVEGAFKRNIKGIDLVLGAKGSPLQLILSSVYHSDYPTGNIAVKDVSKFSKYPSLKTAIPLSYGDSYRGYRVVGTTKDYLSHYSATLIEGRSWNKSLEVVVGSVVANELGLKIGDTFASQHGLQEGNGHAHDDVVFEVVGILKSSGTILDRLLLCDIASIWIVHDPGKRFNKDWTQYSAQNITSLLLSFKNRLKAMMLVRRINESSSLQAALPSFELDRLMTLIGSAYSVLNLLAVVILVISSFSIFIALWNKLEERRKDIALFRVMGAGKGFVVRMVIAEGIMIASISYFVGFGLARLLLWIINQQNKQSIYQFELGEVVSLEIYILILSIWIGILSAIFPAWRVSRISIAKVLKNE